MNKEGIDKWHANAIVLNKDANTPIISPNFNLLRRISFQAKNMDSSPYYYDLNIIYI
jgi:hypothetical protein